MEVSLAYVPRSSGHLFIAFLHDISERKSLFASMEQMALRDTLTGLPNRRALMQTLPEALQRANRSGQRCAVFFLDLDRFKQVNDRYGHEEGDELLRQFAQRVRGAVRKTDTVGRLAGDEFIVIVGPSGCGKSTLLRMLCGLESITSGTMQIGERTVNHLPPAERGIAMVFQSYALYQHMTVYQNMAFGLKVAGKDKAAIRQRINQAAAILKIDHLLERLPRELSGGQQQRVAIARAIVSDPTFLICDEPTGDLDRQSAEEILGLLQQLNREHGKTIIMVTHDPKAAEYATHTVHLDKGELADAPLAH